MAITISNPSSTSSNRSQAWGDGLKKQLLTWSALSGATSGTVTCDALSLVKHVFILNGKLTHTAAPTYATNVATLAFTVPAETAASVVKGGVTYTAVANQGAGGNSITVAYTSGGTAGSEVVTQTGSAVSVQIQSGVSTITQVRTAVNAYYDANTATALVTATGTSATTVSTATATALTGGVTGGGFGTVLALGI